MTSCDPYYTSIHTIGATSSAPCIPSSRGTKFPEVRISAVLVPPYSHAGSSRGRNLMLCVFLCSDLKLITTFFDPRPITRLPFTFVCLRLAFPCVPSTIFLSELPLGPVSAGIYSPLRTYVRFLSSFILAYSGSLNARVPKSTPQ